LEYNSDGSVNEATIIPFVDGGTEGILFTFHGVIEMYFSFVIYHFFFIYAGFKGNARVVYPGKTACIECNLDLYPKQVTYQSFDILLTNTDCGSLRESYPTQYYLGLIGW